LLLLLDLRTTLNPFAAPARGIGRAGVLLLFEEADADDAPLLLLLIEGERAKLTGTGGGGGIGEPPLLLLLFPKGRGTGRAGVFLLTFEEKGDEEAEDNVGLLLTFILPASEVEGESDSFKIVEVLFSL